MTTRLAVHQVEAGTGGIDGGETDRRGDEPLRQHLETEDSLEGTGRAERVADRSLDRVDGDIARAEDTRDRHRLHRVVEGRAGAVRGDEADARGRHVRGGRRRLDR